MADFQLTGQTVIVHGFLRALKDLPQESEDADGDGLQSDALQDGLKVGEQAGRQAGGAGEGGDREGGTLDAGRKSGRTGRTHLRKLC